jgi:hypothetical protein
VLEAIRAGRSYCVIQPLGEASDFAIEGLVGDVRQAKVGEKLRVRIPKGAPLPTQVRVYGPATVQADGLTVVLQKPGAVQIEVWAQAPGRFLKKEWKPWILPNPIWVYAGDADRFESDVNLPVPGTP